jgi:hypothetical protein
MDFVQTNGAEPAFVGQKLLQHAQSMHILRQLIEITYIKCNALWMEQGLLLVKARTWVLVNADVEGEEDGGDSSR